ncbi:MAG TPA: hypothetical protein VN519_08655 [Bryobacteraceae bacterium]|nr:hypothetical protein [Bryobacteraceae bacterium]
MRFPFLFIAAVAAVAPAAAQGPLAISCNNAACTFTLSFDDGWAHLAGTTGAPYSGQFEHSNLRTLPNGTHMLNQSSGYTIYRDSEGRVRTERHAYPAARPDRPKPPDDFVVAEIHDPVAGFEYILDPVNKVAHRRAFKPEMVEKWNPAEVTGMKTAPASDTPFGKREFLGTKMISGVTAYGLKTTASRPLQNGTGVSSSEEEWFDPASGAVLTSTSDRNGDETTTTLANYSNAEPAPSLFHVPEGYQTIDETATFHVAHQRAVNGGFSGGGMHGAQITAACEDSTCQFTFDPGNSPVNSAVTGAPWSGHQALAAMAESGADSGTPRASTSGIGHYRDSDGRLRTDPAPVGRGATARMPRLVEIDDPVAGYIYILDPGSQTAWREKTAFRSFPYRTPMTQPAGKRTAPNGRTVTIEDLGTQVISGVTATGQRNTTTSPPGTYSQNDETIVTVNERWMDPKTGVVILTKNTGPRANTTISVPDYKEGDPDASLFQVPAGYKIVDEAGLFTFTASNR